MRPGMQGEALPKGRCLIPTGGDHSVLDNDAREEIKVLRSKPGSLIPGLLPPSGDHMSGAVEEVMGTPLPGHLPPGRALPSLYLRKHRVRRLLCVPDQITRYPRLVFWAVFFTASVECQC